MKPRSIMTRLFAAALLIASQAERQPAVLGPATEAPLPGENGAIYLDYTDEAPDSQAVEGSSDSDG